MQNPFVWYDLMTPDLQGAMKFYGSVVGWNFTDQPPAYKVANVGNIGVGGMMATPPELKGMSPFWSGYVFTPQVEATCAHIKELGGRVHREPWDVPGILRMAVVVDPTGAAFNVMQPLMADGGERARQGASGTIGWCELYSSDVEKAVAFYEKAFGWTKGFAMDMGPMGTYQMMQIDGQDIAGIMKKFDAMPMSVWNYYFFVDGIDAAIAKITAGGGKISNGPHQVPTKHWIVQGIDPQGAHFSLMSANK
jgi:uncharacterized protein